MFHEILRTIFTSFASIIALFILTKLMGKRQIAQLSVFDYVNGITIGSIAAEMATSEFTDVLKPFVAMIVYTIVIVAFDLITRKSLAGRHFLEGKAVIIFNNGTIYKKNLKRANIDVTEFIALCRVSGYFDLSKLQTAILESNGCISFIPLATERPTTPADMNLNPEQEFVVANVIVDGKIMKQNLRHTGNDEKWLMHQLKAQGVSNVSDVLLATCDVNHKICVYKMNDEPMKLDIFE